MTEQGEHRPNPGERPLYGVGELSRMVGIRRYTIDYLTRLGLVEPQFVTDGKRRLRKFSQNDVIIFQSARTMLDLGEKPRFVVEHLRPDLPSKVYELTYAEAEVLRTRYLIRSIPWPLEDIGESMGVSRQTVHKIERSALIKLVRNNRETIIERAHQGRATAFGEKMFGAEVSCPDCGKPSNFDRYTGTLAEPMAVFKCPDGFEFSHEPSSLLRSDKDMKDIEP